MSATMIAFVLALAAGAALALAIAGLRPAHPDLKAAVAHMRPSDLGVRRVSAPPVELSHLERLGERARRHTARWPLLQAPERDLDLLQISAAEHYGRKALFALAGFAAVALLPALVGLGFLLPLLLGLIAALLGWMAPDFSVRETAKRRREDFAYAAVSYLRLVAISRAAGAGLISSLESAATASGSWMFTRISQELQLAKLAGITAWDALDTLSRDIEVPELREVADIIRLADQSGAAVADSLMARAASLRDRLLTKEQTEANAATSSMGVPLAGLAVTFLIALLIPAMLQLTSMSA